METRAKKRQKVKIMECATHSPLSPLNNVFMKDRDFYTLRRTHYSLRTHDKFKISCNFWCESVSCLCPRGPVFLRGCGCDRPFSCLTGAEKRFEAPPAELSGRRHGCCHLGGGMGHWLFWLCLLAFPRCGVAQAVGVMQVQFKMVN